MRNILLSEVTRTIKEMCIEANHFLSPDMREALSEAADSEKSVLGKIVLEQLKENLLKIANDEKKLEYMNLAFNSLYSSKALEQFQFLIKGLELR